MGGLQSTWIFRYRLSASFGHWKESLSGLENPVHFFVTMGQNISVRILLSAQTQSILHCLTSSLESQLKMLTLNDLTVLQGMSGWSLISLRTSNMLNYWQPNGNGLAIMGDHIFRFVGILQNRYCD